MMSFGKFVLVAVSIALCFQAVAAGGRSGREGGRLRPCAPGTYNDAGTCKPCDAGTYSSRPGSSSCATCPANSSPNAAQTACVCDDDFFLPPTPATSSSDSDSDAAVVPSTGCVACPANSVRTGSAKACSCAGGFADCDGNADNGCEADLSLDGNCGACGTRCTALPNVFDASCTASACVIASCAADYSNCDSNVANGCESVTNFDDANCGACGNDCLANALPGFATCNGAGNCVVGSCEAGYTVCQGSTGDVCVDTLTDVNFCGSCTATTCSSCADGTCTP